MRPRIRKISDWNELIKFIDSINTNKQTCYLYGFINKINGETIEIDSIYLKTAPISLIKKDVKSEKNDSNQCTK